MCRKEHGSSEKDAHGALDGKTGGVYAPENDEKLS